MSTGTLIFVLLVVGMVGMHLFGHSRHGAGAAGGGHGRGGGCCGGGGHGRGGHEAEDSERRPTHEHEPEQTAADSEPAEPVADEPVVRPRAAV